MQCRNAMMVWDNTDLRQRHPFFLDSSTWPWIERRNPMDHHRNPLMQIFGMLGQHHWINAVAFDVLFSAMALACWSTVANLDTRGMVRCSLFPWAGQVTEGMKLVKYHILPDARANGGLRGGATRSGGEYLLQDDPLEVSSDESEEPPWIKRRSHAKSQRKAKRAPSEEPAPPIVRTTRGRPRRTSHPERHHSNQSRGTERREDVLGP